MEKMTGMELLAHLCARSPGTRVIFITGREDSAAEAVAATAHCFVVAAESVFVVAEAVSASAAIAAEVAAVAEPLQSLTWWFWLLGLASWQRFDLL